MTLELDPYDAAALALSDKFGYQVSYPDSWSSRMEVKVTAVVRLTVEEYTEWQRGVSNAQSRPYPTGVR